MLEHTVKIQKETKIRPGYIYFGKDDYQVMYIIKSPLNMSSSVHVLELIPDKGIWVEIHNECFKTFQHVADYFISKGVKLL